MSSLMDPSLRALLTELESFGRAHDERESDHTRKMLNLDPETAHLISILVRSGRRRRLLEIGTSNGYSTLWLAWAAGQHGRVTSIDRSADKLALADANLRRAALRDRVDLRHGDGTEVVAALPGPFDLVFFDADRRSAPAQLAQLLPKLMADVLILADNALSHPVEVAAYLAAVRALPGFEHAVVPVGKGLSIAYGGESAGT
jgi:predicted O-methyltransferase YrrM